MNRTLKLISRFDRGAFSREVETELQFHIEMQALEYERAGLTPEESIARAAVRFGDFAKIKTQCIRIGLQNDARTRAMKTLFTLAFLSGVVIRILSSEFHLMQMGNTMIAIAVLGGLLLYGKRRGSAHFRPERKDFRLGIADGFDSPPVSFDEKGRTPFERVRED